MPLDSRTCFTVNLRDRLSCKICQKQPLAVDGYHKGFEYHHVTPKSQGGSDAVENIALLCRDCHLAGHQGRENIDENLAKYDLAAPRSFPCGNCAVMLSVENVEMNCGWYLCHSCETKTHLWDHFFRH